MSAPTELEMAILAMDAYEQQTGGLNIGNGIGNFSLGQNSGNSGAFFAQSYTFSGGTVIAYSGTNGLGDVILGWPGGLLGTSSAQEYIDAAQFYQQINGDSIDPNANIFLTGHSLGGGLAGFVGSLYGVSAEIFNSMNFLGAAQDAWDKSRTIELSPGVYGPTDEALRDVYYLGDEPPVGPPTANTVQGQYLPGELAEITRSGWQPSPVTSPFGGIDAFNLHKQNLLVIAMEGDLQTDKSWHAVGPEVYRSLFSACAQ